jgi:hypothetical protein
MVLTAASEPRPIFTFGSIRRMTFARLSSSSTTSTVPIFTPAMRTAAFASRPATESNIATTRYPFFSPNSYFPTAKVMYSRITDPTSTSSPTFASALNFAMQNLQRLI